LLTAVVSGCNTVPPGYEQVKAVVKPGGRTVAFAPFSSAPGTSFELVDGIKLAELAAIALQTADPKLKVLGPSSMRGALRDSALDEGRLHEFGREVGAQLLVVGEVTFLTEQHDKLLQSREGAIGLRFRVLDVSKFPPKSQARIDWRLRFPEGVGGQFDPQYVMMGDTTFRAELLRFAARRMAALFYKHVRKIRPVSELEVHWRVE